MKKVVPLPSSAHSRNKRHFAFAESKLPHGKLPHACQMADNKSYVNYIHLHVQTIPIPKGKQAQFRGGCRRGHSLSLGPLWGALIGHYSGLGGSA